MFGKRSFRVWFFLNFSRYHPNFLRCSSHNVIASASVFDMPYHLIDGAVELHHL